MAIPRRAPPRRKSDWVWQHHLAARRRAGIEAAGPPESVAWNPHLRAVYRRRLAASGTETSDPLQHTNPQTVKARAVSRRPGHPAGPPATGKDQAADCAAVSS